MRKQQLKVIANLVSIFLLCTTLLISISFGWYTNNKEVHANGLHASSATDSLVVSNKGAYSTQIGKDEPNPTDPPDDSNKEVTGVLAGEIVYFTISISSADGKTKLSLNDLKIAVSSIFGDEYFTEPAVEYTEPAEGQYSLTKPTDANKAHSYSVNERVIQSIMRKEGYANDYFISMDKAGKYYINNLGENSKGELEVKTKSELTADQLTYYQSGLLTGHKYVYDETETYPTYYDPANGKEYYVTYVDGKNYINYIYETGTGNNKTRYNMIDIYSYEVYRVYGSDVIESTNTADYKDIYSSPSSVNHSNYTGVSFPKANGLDKSISMFPLYDPTYFKKNCSSFMTDEKIAEVLSKQYLELTYIFKFVFNYDSYKENINISSVSYREIKFNNVIISFYEHEGGNT